MKKFNYTIAGELKSAIFYEDWSEVPFNAFLRWQECVKDMKQVESELEDIQKELASLQEQYNKVYFGTGLQKKQAAKIAKQAQLLKEKYKAIQDGEYFQLQAKAISSFTTVPLCDLLLMDNSIEDVLDDSFDYSERLTTNHFQFYRVCLRLLARNPLPTDSVSAFKWQSKTDAEISDIENKINSLPFYAKNRLNGKYRALLRELDAAKSATYQVQNIWDHSTYANKQFQTTAKQYIEALEQNDDHSVLPYLISMLFVESGAEKRILDDIRNEKDGKAYLERYAQAYKELFDRNKALFFEQQKQLSVAHVLGLRGFFLLK